MVKINLILDRPQNKYNPGDVINMEIRVQNDSPMKFRSIYVRMYGYAHVEWSESHTVQRDGKSHTEYTTYSSNETYFKNYETVAGSRSGSEEVLRPGSHVYHARYILPQNLPENHENQYGHIRYEVKAHIDVPWGFDEKERVAFYVNPRRDLNAFRHLAEPVREEESQTFGCCCWESEPLKIFNILPRSAFVPGERVPFTLEVNNESDVSIDSATIKLQKKISYHAYSPSSKSREEHETLWMHDFFGSNRRRLVAPLQNKVFSTELYFDPTKEYNFFDGSGIITVSYVLESKARSSGCHSNLTNKTWINMGTIPIGYYGNGQTAHMVPMVPYPSMPPSFPSVPPAFPSAPPNDPNEPISKQPLPSYNESVSQPMGTGVGWSGFNNIETPPPTFNEAEFMEKKDKPEKSEKQ